MSAARVVHGAGVLCGWVTAVMAGVVLGGAWWAVAAGTAVGAASGRNGALVHAVGTVALVGGAVAADTEWLVPVLVAGVVATVEAGAVPERVTRARPSIPIGPVLATPVVAATMAAIVLVLGELGPGPGVPGAVVAAAASGALLATLRT